jgi:hypothetical protein
MQHEKAQRLRKQWGNEPCDHPSTEKEYYLGSDTGDKVCTTCGRVVDNEDYGNARFYGEREPMDPV